MTTPLPIPLHVQTDRIFLEFEGEFHEREKYCVVRTPSNPSYYWGNYLIFENPPQNADLESWKSIFRTEISSGNSNTHYAFTWRRQTPEFVAPQSFVEDGFIVDEYVTLSTQKVMQPRKFNSNLTVELIQTRQQWDEVTQLQILCREPIYDEASYSEFKRRQFKRYEDMWRAGLGAWFGAYDKGKLVGDLGLYFKGTLGRFQSVETHPKARCQGVCSTLVYSVAKFGFEKYALDRLVMVADENYHAARIYESVGFAPTERGFQLWRRKLK